MTNHNNDNNANENLDNNNNVNNNLDNNNLFNTKDEKKLIQQDDIKFLIDLQKEWTDVIVGRMIADNEVEHLEKGKQVELVSIINHMEEMVSRIRLVLEEYCKILKNEAKIEKNPQRKKNTPRSAKRSRGLTEEEIKIIAGLIETLTIKHQSMVEQEEYIELEIRRNYSHQITNLYQEAYQDLFALNKKDKLEDIDYHISEIMNATHEKIRNRITETENQMLQYLKNDILFEIVTLEDLKKYSIPKLNQELTLVKEFKKLDQRILKELQHRGITPITPHEHEKFNSQKHEILIAEVKEGFEKGEVIEVMNSGFEYIGSVIRRATIIAAV